MLALTLALALVLVRAALVAQGGAVASREYHTLEGRQISTLWLRAEQRRDVLLVVAHGGLATGETLLPLCWEARARGVDCVAVDLLGHGASSPMPARATLDAMARAIGAIGAIGAYREVRFVGHSLGAVVGCGRAFSCARSVSIGQHTRCGREVFGETHRALGLAPAFYPLSHVLEPWNPAVLARACTLALGPSFGAGDGRTPVRVVLAWLSLASGLTLGVVLARRARAIARVGAPTRGVLGAMALYGALVLGGERAVWGLGLRALDDLVVTGASAVTSLVVATALAALGVRRAGAGALVGALVGVLVSLAATLAFRAAEMRSIVSLVPGLVLLVAPVALGLERLSRPTSAGVVDAAAFVATTLGAVAAVLVPQVRP